MEGGAPVGAWLKEWSGLSEQRGTTKKRAGLGVWAELRAKRRPIGWGRLWWAGLTEERLPIEAGGSPEGAWLGKLGGA